jgi:hypothetical protein
VSVIPFVQRGERKPDKLDRALEHFQEGTQEDFFWGRVNTAGSEEDYYWRRLSDNWSHKDVLPATYLDIHNQCYEAYNANPLANAIIEMGVNLCLGDGLQVTSTNKKIQKVIDRFWKNRSNRMSTRQFDLALELALYGELFLHYFVSPAGDVTLRQIDPSLVDELECNPEDIEDLRRIHTRPVSITPTSEYQPQLLDPTMKGHWYTVPTDVEHFAINKVSNAKRGKSDLATLLPWMRRYKDWLIDRVRINKYKSAFLWDVKLSGADRAAIQAKMMEYARPPEPGSVLVHNESEDWKAVQPQIGADDVSSDGHAIKLMVAMGAGLPEHWLSEGGDVNRATAAEMGLPVLKRYQRRQDFLVVVFRSILDRVLSEARNAGRLPRTTDLENYEVTFPRILPEDSVDTGMTSWHMAQGLQIARSMGIISDETASNLFLEALRSDRDPTVEWEKAATAGPAAPPAPPATLAPGATA